MHQPSFEESTLHPLPAKRRLPEPPPKDPLGKRLCELFPYRWQPIVAPAPGDATQKPEWKTLTYYPLRPRSLWNLWQDAAYLVGVRFGQTTQYAVIDIDASSSYHPARAPETLRSLRAALESIGIYRIILTRSSWSGGLHIYIPLPESVPTFSLAVALKQSLEAEGFAIRAGQLELFPNAKGYGKNGLFTEYNAHRLPLQPATGSTLLNDDLQPISGGLTQFFAQWDTAVAGQELHELKQAIAHHRKQYRPRPTRHENKVEAWQQDLLSEMEEGWTGPGQTNHLLKTIACYGVVFGALTGDALVNYVEETAVNCPGYKEWCQHQHEIQQRAKDWAIAAEGYYWALGTSPTRTGDIHAANNIVPINRQRSEEAQERIKRAVEELSSQGTLPDGKTARMKAIATHARCSFSTLQKYPELWEMRSAVTALLEQDSGVLVEDRGAIAETVELAPGEELQAIPYMKGGELESWFETSQFSLDRNGEGPGRGEGCFPQPAASFSGYPSELECLDTIEVIVQIQVQMRRLGWTVEQAQRFIAERFDGKRRSQLIDCELRLMLSLLREQC